MTYTIMFRTVVKSGKIPIRKQVTKFCLKHANIVLAKLDIDKEFDWLLINQLRKRCDCISFLKLSACTNDMIVYRSLNLVHVPMI